jgi:rod shape-determining protein MreD
MRYWVGGAIAFGAALFQAASVEQFKIFGVAPNLVLVLIVSWTVVRGLDDVLPMAAVAGITLSFIGLQSPGLVLLALLPVIGLGLVRELRIVHSDTVLVLALVAASTAMYDLVLLASVMATGGVLDARAAVSGIVLPTVVVNLAITPPVHLVMRLAKPHGDRHRLLAY